jgi:hypothetical protein
MIVRPYRFASLGDERQGHRRERQAEPGDPPGALTKYRDPEQHGHRRIQGHDDASVKSVFTDTVNNTGFFGGKTGGFAFFFFVVPLSFILTQYTITDTTRPRTCPRRRTRRRTPRPRASGGRSSTPASPAGSSC